MGGPNLRRQTRSTTGVPPTRPQMLPTTHEARTLTHARPGRVAGSKATRGVTCRRLPSARALRALASLLAGAKPGCREQRGIRNSTQSRPALDASSHIAYRKARDPLKRPLGKKASKIPQKTCPIISGHGVSRWLCFFFGHHSLFVRVRPPSLAISGRPPLPSSLLNRTSPYQKALYQSMQVLLAVGQLKNTQTTDHVSPSTLPT